jgi:hypothetical protein
MDRGEQITDRHLNYLKVVILSQLLLEANDELKGSQAYKYNIKLQINRTSDMLERVFKDDYSIIYANNPEICTNVLNKIDNLIDKIKSATVDELVMIDAVIEKYYENQDWFIKHENAEFLKLK